MRFLITADWHINNYKNYNSSVGFRLGQFIKLAYQTVEIGKKQGCPILVIAGDFIDIPILSPKIQHVVKGCIDILKGGFDKIYYILGQHDLDTKGTINKDDTILSLYDDDKFIYADHKILKYNGVKVGFQNWTSQQDTSWIDGKVDVLIGHYTKSNLFGQEIDDSKFDLMIHGDIHNDQVIGKFVSICNPIQKDMSSAESGSMIVYDTLTKIWNRVKTDEPHTKYLRIEYTRDPKEEGWASPILYKIFKPVDTSSSGEVYEVPVPEWSEIDELINKVVEHRGFQELHNEVLAKTQDFQEIDFNFQLKYIDIKGFRSVESLHIDFKGNDIVLLLGDNGSGKSSILEALHHLFYYDTHLQDNATEFDGEEPEALQLEYGLFYQGKMYKIKKGAEWGLEIDGTEVGFPSKPKFEKSLPEYLPFLNYSDVFFISSEISDLTGRFTSERRSELLSKFFKFDRVLSYNETAQKLRQETGVQYGTVNDELSKINNIISYLQGELQQFNDLPDEQETKDNQTRLEGVKKQAKLYKEWQEKCKSLHSQRDAIQTSLNNIEKPGELDDLSAKLVTKRNEKQQAQQRYDTEQKNYLNLKQWITSYASAKAETSRAEGCLKSVQDEVCPTCGQPINEDKVKELRTRYSKDVEIAKEKENSLKETLKTLDPLADPEAVNLEKKDKELSNLREKVKSFDKEINKLLNDVSKCQAYESTKKTLEDQIASYDKQIDYKEQNAPIATQWSDEDEQQLQQVNQICDKLKRAKELKDKISEQQKSADEVKAKLQPLQERMDNLYSYQMMTATTGDIYVAILKRLAKSFSSENIEWFVEEGVYRNHDYLVFNAKMKVKKTWRVYEALSAGQKNLVDLDFLGKMLASKSGLLVLDETLKHLDTNHSVEAAELLSKFNVNTLLIATHSISFPQYTQKLLLELDDKGRTQVTEEV